MLYADHASLGGRVLKYDSGETAILVTVWGGLTLYTDAQPSGLPAVRTADAAAPTPPSIGLSDMQNEAIDQALKAEGPAIVSCVVPADELPNFPHVDLEKAENFAKAKIKETILVLTGR